MLDILFLGTGAAVPSRERSTSCIAVRSGRDMLLLDCGEGAQRQLMASPVSFMKIGAILITHMHGDHVLGLPGLLQTMGLSGRKEPLDVYGPAALEPMVRTVMEATEGLTEYRLDFHDVSGLEPFSSGSFAITPYRTSHGIESFGYVIREADAPGRLDREKALSLGIEDGPEMARLKAGETVKGVEPSQVIGDSVKGLSLSYTGDTAAVAMVSEASAGVDVLIHEATYMASEAKLAEEHGHSTTEQAAKAAKDSGARCLIATHVSNRYKDRSAVEAELRGFFPESYVAEDMRLFRVTRDSVGFTDSD